MWNCYKVDKSDHMLINSFVFILLIYNILWKTIKLIKPMFTYAHSDLSEVNKHDIKVQKSDVLLKVVWNQRIFSCVILVQF